MGNAIRMLLESWKSDKITTVGGLAFLVYYCVTQFGGVDVDTKAWVEAFGPFADAIKLVVGVLIALGLSVAKVSASKTKP